MSRIAEKTGAQPTAHMEGLENPELFQALVEEFRPALIHYFTRRIPAPEEAEDLAHDVFVRLIRRRTIGDIKALRGYVFETANNVLIDWTRRNRTRARSAHRPIDEDIPDNTVFETERVLLAKEEIRRVTASLLELPERTRTIFVLRRFEGMKYKDIADRLGLSLSTVEKHMQQATIHLLGRPD